MEMTSMYDARGGSFDVLRSKITIKLPIQSSEKMICMGNNMHSQNYQILFSLTM